MTSAKQSSASGRDVKNKPKRRRCFWQPSADADKRARPEHRPLGGLEALLEEEEDGAEDSSLTADAVLAFSQVADLAAEAAENLEDLWAALEAAGDSVSVDTVATALRRLPDLLGAAAAATAGGDEASITAHLDKGLSIEASPVPSERRRGTQTSSDDGSADASLSSSSSEAFVWVHERVEAELDRAAHGTSQVPSLEWLAIVSIFYGALRPGPPLPRHVLEDCADFALKKLESQDVVSNDDLVLAGKVALGAALSGSLGRHKLYIKVSLLVAARLQKRKEISNGVSKQVFSWETVHDISLALALLRPWDSKIAKAATKVRNALASAQLSTPLKAVEDVRLGAESVAGKRLGETKENQDAFFCQFSDCGSIANIVVVDGHGKQGGSLAGTARDQLAQALLSMHGGPGTAQELADAIMASDASLLIHEHVDAELSGASCLALRVDGLRKDWLERNISVAHLGDCRAVLGRMRVESNAGKASWTAVRLTDDHRPGEATEAARLVAAGGCIRKATGPPGVDPALLGPPRLWHRQQVHVPGLAMSRGLGDTMGKACGLSPQATVMRLKLTTEDTVLIAGSDGIFDVLSDAEVLQCCRHFAASREACKAAAAVVAAARRGWELKGPCDKPYIDDCTCVVLFL
eukprot:TRINITY_DN75373_c0_g1_i1.p1 TRINITY_DN75373_c0_g1~~TRINITY_DN75373_c0_g1_i1.p1  ORF type:complete len:637 (-),score=128.25 TRINITY_DN75373_c0_g1_i1:100-2010(-)